MSEGNDPWLEEVADQHLAVWRAVREYEGAPYAIMMRPEHRMRYDFIIHDVHGGDLDQMTTHVYGLLIVENDELEEGRFVVLGREAYENAVRLGLIWRLGKPPEG